MAQRLLVILFSLFLFAPAMLTHVYLHTQKKQVKRQVKHRIISGLDKSELVLLSFHVRDTASQLRWEHSKEFEFNQQMYDVVDRELLGDTVKYWCWWDYEETKLNKQLASIVQRLLSQDQDRQQSGEQLLLFFKMLYCPAPQLHDFRETRISDNLNYYNQVSFIQPYLSPPSPPPDPKLSTLNFII